MCFNGIVCASMVLSVLKWYCLCFNGIVCASVVLFVLQWYCLCFNGIVCASMVLYVLQWYCLCFNDIVCTSMVLSVLQWYCLYFNSIVCASMVLSVLQFTVSNCSLVSWNFQYSSVWNKIICIKIERNIFDCKSSYFYSQQCQSPIIRFFKLYSCLLLQSIFHMKTNDNPLFASWIL